MTQTSRDGRSRDLGRELSVMDSRGWRMMNAARPCLLLLESRGPQPKELLGHAHSVRKSTEIVGVSTMVDSETACMGYALGN